MLRGKTFKLDRPTRAFVRNKGEQHPLIVPAGSTVKVVPTHASKMADVFWDGQTLTMFVHDLDTCEGQAEESRPPS